MIGKLLGDLDIKHWPIIISSHGMFMRIKLETSSIDTEYLLSLDVSHGKAPPEEGEDKYYFQDKLQNTQLMVILNKNKTELKEMLVFVNADGVTSDPVAEDLRYILCETEDSYYYGDLYYDKESFNELLINMLKFAIKKLKLNDLKLKTEYQLPTGYADFLTKELGIKVKVLNESAY